MGAIASQITTPTIVYPAVYSGANQRKHQSSASLAFVWGIHRWPVNSPHKWPVKRKMFPFDDVIMRTENWTFLEYAYKTLLNHSARNAVSGDTSYFLWLATTRHLVLLSHSISGDTSVIGSAITGCQDNQVSGSTNHIVRLGSRLYCGRKADFRFAPSQWETALFCNDVSHWLGASLESAL